MSDYCRTFAQTTEIRNFFYNIVYTLHIQLSPMYFLWDAAVTNMASEDNFIIFVPRHFPLFDVWFFAGSLP